MCQQTHRTIRFVHATCPLYELTVQFLRWATLCGAYPTLELEIVGFANVPIQRTRTYVTALWSINLKQS